MLLRRLALTMSVPFLQAAAIYLKHPPYVEATIRNVPFDQYEVRPLIWCGGHLCNRLMLQWMRQLEEAVFAASLQLI